MTYNRYSRTTRTRLTPPAELIGRRVQWRPKHPDGKRAAAVTGWVEGYDAEARTLTIRVPRTVSAWQPHPHQDITVALSQGPFTPF